MRTSIRFKLGFILGSFILLILATIGATFWAINSSKSDAQVINLAGRQRMLSQKITKEVLAFEQGRIDSGSVLSTVNLFEESLETLLSGDPKQGIPPTTDPAIVAQLNKVQSMWKGFRENIEELVSLSEERNSIYKYLLANNMTLLEETNRLVSMMEDKKMEPAVINLAGRQRMLSQKITKDALALALQEVDPVEILSTVTLFDRVIEGFINGDRELGIKPVKDAEIIAQLRNIEKIWKPFKADIEKLVEISGEANKHLGYILANNLPLLKEMNTAVKMYEKGSRTKIDRAWTMQIVFLVITLIVFAIGWYFLSGNIIKPVKKIAETARDVAEGNLNGEPLDIKTKDELGQLAETVNIMRENLNRMISQIRDGASQLSLASSQLAKGNTEFSQRITEQSSSVEETASTMEEIASMVKQNADTAKEADKLASECRNKAEEGGDVMAKMMDAIEEIKQSSKKISDIINVIEEIAFQTNLLALNAAVEAARAGEQGKGFAVVAVEVRNLAQRSAQAAKEITALIKENLSKTEGGAQFAETTRATLEEIIVSVKKVTDLIAEISAASQEQASGVEQVNKAITQLDEITQKNAALAEESSAASEQMSAQAKQLLNLVGNFQLKDGLRTHEFTQLTIQEHQEEADTNVTSIRPVSKEDEKDDTSQQQQRPLKKAMGDDIDGFVEMS